MTARLGTVTAVSIALFASGCVHTLPPPAAPDPVVPTVEARPLADGQGRVLIDVTDGPTNVYRWVSADAVVGMDKDVPIVASRVTSEVLCTTPCVIDGPPGTYRLGFPFHGGGGFDMAEVQILTEPTVYRRSLGTRRRGGGGLALGIVSTSFGGMSLACGAAFLPIGLTRDEGEGGGFVIAGAVTLIAGAILTALGVWGIAASPTIEQQGAEIQFTLPRVDVSATATAP